MRGKTAKRLHAQAEEEMIGEPRQATKVYARFLKTMYRDLVRHKHINPVISKRQQRLQAT